MAIYYSASSGGFYDDDIHTTIPSDSVRISKELHIALLTAQSEGQIICTGPDGKPTTKAPDAPDLPTVKRSAKNEVDDRRQKEEQKGLTYEFPDGVTDVVQLRDTRDLVNVSSLVTTAQLMKATGFEGSIQFQAESNVTHQMTPDEIIDMGLAAAAYIQGIYAISWSLKDAIDSAEDFEAVNSAKIWPE